MHHFVNDVIDGLVSLWPLFHHTARKCRNEYSASRPLLWLLHEGFTRWGSGKKAKGLVSFFMPLIPHIPPAWGWHRQLGFCQLSGLRTIEDAWVHSKLSNNFIQLCEYPCIYIVGVFNPVILHPNVFPSGKVSLSLIDKNKGWKPQITTKEVHCDLKVEDKYSLW